MDVVRAREELAKPVGATGATARPLPAPDAASSDDVADLLERAAWIGAEGVAVVQGTTIRWANPSIHAICARTPDSLVGGDVHDLRVRQLLADGGAGDTCDITDWLDRPRSERAVLERADGSIVVVAVAADRVEAVPDGHWVLRLREIAAHVRADEALRASEARFRALADHAPIGVFQSDVGIRLAFVNPHFAHIWGQEADAVLGDAWLQGVIESDRDQVLAALAQVLGGRESAVTFHVLRPDHDMRTVEGRFVPVEGEDKQTSFVGSVADVTEAHAREAELAWKARHDALTGLPNRIELWDRIHAFVEEQRRPVTLLFFDLDDFKLVNDSLGHQAGDKLLTTVAERLLDAVRLGDVVARFGGDEFVVFCPGIGTEAEATRIADRLLGDLREPVELSGKHVRVTASAGVLVSQPDADDPEAMLRDADVAMYQAKAAGKARTAVFDEAARERVRHQLDVVSDLRRALEEGDVGVFYQPIVDHSTLTIVGAEALLRYEHSRLGPLPANKVIEIAESSGVIDELGAYVLDRACADLVTWRCRAVGGWRPSYVSVNLAAAQLADASFPARIGLTLDRHELSPSDLCLELTESQLMTDVGLAEEVLAAIDDAGVRLAIDDFGTGYSSLSYLQRVPVSLVKIDRSFCSDPTDPFVQAIIEAVVTVTRTLGGSVVAEGIETLEQLDALGALGCELLQGYLLARPQALECLPTTGTYDRATLER